MTNTAKRPLFFCYELGLKGWEPCVYHGEEPRKIKADRDTPRSPVYRVPFECIDMDGNPLFEKLTRTFPAPSLPVS